MEILSVKQEYGGVLAPEDLRLEVYLWVCGVHVLPSIVTRREREGSRMVSSLARDTRSGSVRGWPKEHQRYPRDAGVAEQNHLAEQLNVV